MRSVCRAIPLRAEFEREDALGIDRAAAAATRASRAIGLTPAPEAARDTRVPEQKCCRSAIERETSTPEPVAAVDLRTGITAVRANGPDTAA